MAMAKLFKLVILLVLIPAISGCTRYTTIRQHKEFAQAFPKYNSVAIIPGYIFINQQTKNGTKFTKPSPERVNNIMQMAQKQLSAKGYTVTDISSEDDTEEHEDFSESYKKSIGKLYSGTDSGKEENALSTEGNIGSVPKNIAGKSDVGLLLMLGYEGNEMSQEQVTKNFAKDMALAMVGVPMDTHIKEGSAIISLVEKSSGNLLWTNLGVDFENYGSSLVRTVTQNNVMETAFERALKSLPDKNGNLNGLNN